MILLARAETAIKFSSDDFVERRLGPFGGGNRIAEFCALSPRRQASIRATPRACATRHSSRACTRIADALMRSLTIWAILVRVARSELPNGFV